MGITALLVWLSFGGILVIGLLLPKKPKQSFLDVKPYTIEKEKIVYRDLPNIPLINQPIFYINGDKIEEKVVSRIEIGIGSKGDITLRLFNDQSILICEQATQNGLSAYSRNKKYKVESFVADNRLSFLKNIDAGEVDMVDVYYRVFEIATEELSNQWFFTYHEAKLAYNQRLLEEFNKKLK